MRLNRGTLGLIVILLVALVVILVVNTNQMSAPGVTPTAVAANIAGALLDIQAENIVRYEIRDNNTGQFTALTKDAGGAWQIDGTNTLVSRSPDQNLIGTTAGQITAINYTNTFEDDALATFGLDHPLYTVLVLTNDGTLRTIYIGSKSPTSARYYAVVQSLSGQAVPDSASATEEAAASATTEAVAPTQAPAAATDEAASATAESTESSGSPKRIVRQATEEPTAEVTPDASAVDVDNVASQADNGGAVEVEPAPTVEVTFDPSSFTPMPTDELTAEVTLEATANLVQSPQVTLTGSQTIYLIPQTVLDTLKNWLTLPPYAPLPTDVPTLEGVVPEVMAENTPVATFSATAEATPEATSEATSEAVAATAEATAAS
jgi:hypothetical protein